MLEPHFEPIGLPQRAPRDPTAYGGGRWKRRYSEFASAIARGKDEADGNVVRGLYQRAVGFTGPDGRITHLNRMPRLSGCAIGSRIYGASGVKPNIAARLRSVSL